MSLETSEKILKVSGFLAITGGILAIIGGIMSMVMGGAATQMPEVASNPEYQKGIVGLIGSILRGLSYILKKQLTQTITISIILAIVLSLIIFIAAGNVKRANQETSKEKKQKNKKSRRSAGFVFI